MERFALRDIGEGSRLTRELAGSGWLAPAAVVSLGATIRLYLSLTNFCISGDGASYIGMARSFAAGDWRAPLGAIFSPLYPLLIAGLHPVVPNWELAGNLVSALMGTAALVSIYGLMREVFGRRDLAIGAAALAAIHPTMAAYAASVRTEAGYIFLSTAAVWLILKGVREERILIAAASGLVAGLAYLYRTEAIGLIFLIAGLPAAAATIWGKDRVGQALILSLAVTAAALALVLPYVTLLHAATGRWTVGREFNAAMMFGLGSVMRDPEQWRRLGFAAGASPLTALAHHPYLYAEKAASDFVNSFYNFAQAAGPVVLILLGAGLWTRGRRIFASAAEAFLAVIVIFYFCGFALSYTGTRFMIHLIPYTFGWVIMGLEAMTGALQRAAAPHGWQMSPMVPAGLAALIMLPETLWPIGYDMRGVRYAGQVIARRNTDHTAVAARDGRVAWYAGAPFVGLPVRPVANLCEWLTARDNVGYLLIGNSDERMYAITPASGCLEFVQRYPRYGAGYYDLYAVRHAAARS